MNGLLESTQDSSRSSDYDIIIPLKRSNNKFNRSVYIPSMTGGKISIEEIEQVLENLELVTCKLPTVRKNWISFIHIFLLPLLGVIYFKNYWGCGYWDDTYEYRYDSNVGFSRYVPYGRQFFSTKGNLTPFFVYIILAILYFAISQKYLLKQIQSSAEKIIEIHQPYFFSKGYRWNIQNSFPDWIELRREYNAEQESSESHYSLEYIRHFSPKKALKQVGNSVFNTFYPKDQEFEQY